MLSFHGQLELKRSLLAQLETHLAAGRLDDVMLSGQALNLYGWSRPLNPPLCARTLGLPEELVQVGCWLTEGFPETPAAIREIVRDHQQLFEAVPVGRDLGRVVPELLLWLLLEEGPLRRFSDLTALMLSAGEALDGDATEPDRRRVHEQVLHAREDSRRALSVSRAGDLTCLPSDALLSTWADLAERVRMTECAVEVVEYSLGNPTAALAAINARLQGAHGLQAHEAPLRERGLLPKLLELLREEPR